MNVNAVFTARQIPEIASIRPTKNKRSRATFATEQRWSGVITANTNKRSSTSRERTVVRDILTEEQRPRKTNWKRRRIGVYQRIGNKSFLLKCFSRSANFGCENSEQCKKRLQACGNKHLMKRDLDVGRIHKPVKKSVPKHSLKFDMAQSFSCEQRSEWRAQKGQLLARATMMNL